jgi:UDP-MurNAc hydroxylase
MRFTLIGHSTLYVETSGPSILVDPWLSGSCYWRSWWHFPPSADARPEWLAPDYIYLTHHHFDHFHYPSLRRLDRRAHVLIPRFGVDVMEDEVRGLGFDQVMELQHGRVTTLAPDVHVASYQYGFDDTTFVISDHGRVLVDFNDCKLRGRPLDQLKEQFPDPTFMFKSHSWAQAYPNCYEAEDQADLALLDRERYLEEFLDTARELRPQYAVPFGSMVAFLHPDTRYLNQFIITPGEVADASHDGSAGDVEVVPMIPGDSWSSETGFSIADTDWYTDRDGHLDRLARSVDPLMEELAEAEQDQHATWESFAAYFGRFARELPPLTARVLVPRPIVFEVPSSPEPYWVLDLRRRTVWRSSVAPLDRADIIRVPEAVLADAIDKRITHFLHGSMRIHIDLRPGGASADLAFWGLLMIWEIGYLPLRQILNPRFAAVLWRRRREFTDYVTTIAGGRGGMLTRMSSQFGTRTEDAPASRPNGEASERERSDTARSSFGRRPQAPAPPEIGRLNRRSPG